MEEIKIPWADWKIEQRIGKGGFGTVYKVRHSDEFNVEEYAAMKVIRFPQDDHENAVLLSEGYDRESIIAYNRERLNKVINEYAVMIRMKGHRNIVRCDDCKAVSHEDGMGWDVFIRMELLTPLHTRLVSGEMSEAEIVKLGEDICQALIQCEKEKIVHRDVKPENIFISEYGDYKLGDFGISRTLEHTTNATRTGSLKFMAPEVYKGQKYGTTVDTYSLGLVMYWLLNKRHMPFAPLNHPATVQENIESMGKRIDGSELIPAPVNGSESLKKIILKACSYFPEDRYSSAEELYHDLKSLTIRNSLQCDSEYILTTTEKVGGENDPATRERNGAGEELEEKSEEEFGNLSYYTTTIQESNQKQTSNWKLTVATIIATIFAIILIVGSLLCVLLMLFLL